MAVPTQKIAIRIDRIDTNATHLAEMVEQDAFFCIDEAKVRAEEIIFHAQRLIEEINESLNEEVK